MPEITPKEEVQEKYRIIFFDLESAPNIGYTWGTWETDVIQFIEEWHLLSFSYKEADEKAVTTYSLNDFESYQTDKKNDYELVKKLWEVLDSADLVVGHNSDAFDLKKAAARFIYHGFPPPSPYKSVDTLKLARKLFAFNSNKLTDLCQYLGIGKKVKTGGFELWLGCMSGDEKAWKLMRKYNAHDVLLLEQLYHRFRGWATTHPNITVKLHSDQYLCPACASPKVQRRGWNYIRAYRAQRYFCLNCTKWSSGPREKIATELLA